MKKDQLLSYSTPIIADAAFLCALVELVKSNDTEQAGWGKRIIVGNAAVVAPDNYYFWAFTTRTDGVIFSELKVGNTTIAAGTTEEVLKTTPLALNVGETQTFDNKVTSIKLTAGADSITAFLKPNL